MRIRGGDKELWEQVKKSVVPLKKHSNTAKNLPSDVSRLKPVKHKTVRSETSRSPEPACQKPAGPKGHGLALDDNTYRKIARRRVPIDARIDLHGMTQAEAHGSLFRFLDDARTKQRRTVLVITGKGMLGKGILREAVPRWLHEMPFRALVAGIREAHASHGGSGALYVRLRKPG